MKKIMAAVPLACLVALAGCGGGDAGSAPATGTSRVASTEQAKALTAEQVANVLRSAGAPLTVTLVYTAESDPNKLLGRPGGYTSKIAFSDSRIPPAELGEGVAPDAIERGGSVEVYPTRAGAAARAQFIQAALQGAQGVLGSEYDYTAGPVLVRVTGTLTPAQAGVYQRATAGATR